MLHQQAVRGRGTIMLALLAMVLTAFVTAPPAEAGNPYCVDDRPGVKIARQGDSTVDVEDTRTGEALAVGVSVSGTDFDISAVDEGIDLVDADWCVKSANESSHGTGLSGSADDVINRNKAGSISYLVLYTVTTPVPDSDGDGYPDDEDCAPNDPDVNPGAEEIPNDGIDNDCQDGDLVIDQPADVRVSLTWESSDDLDLHVIEPSGNRIWLQTPISDTGGTHSGDDIGGACGNDATAGGEESVTWPTDAAVDGTYTVQVANNDCGADTGSWTLEIYFDDVLVHEATGTDQDNVGDAHFGDWEVYDDTFTIG